MLPSRGAIVIAGAALVATSVLTGCGGSSADTAQTPVPTLSTSAEPQCPEPSETKPVHWPAKVPRDLPKPPNAHIDDELTADDGVHIVKFTTPSSLRDSVLFVVEELPKAGYVLGRGDAEATEADAPFVHNNIRGLVRMLQVAECQTQWLLATVDTNATTNSPLLTPHSPTGSPSPLPFG